MFTIKDRRGVTAISYGLIAAGISVAILVSTIVIGRNTSASLCKASASLSSSNGCSQAFIASNGYPLGVNASFVDKLMGGKATYGDALNMMNDNLDNGVDYSNLDTSMPTLLANLNKKDPIVGMYGIYQSSSGVGPVTQYNDFQNFWTQAVASTNGSEPDEYISFSGNPSGTTGQSPLFQIQTQSGTVYNFNYNAQDPNNTSASISNANNGQVFQTNTNMTMGMPSFTPTTQ